MSSERRDFVFFEEDLIHRFANKIQIHVRLRDQQTGVFPGDLRERVTKKRGNFLGVLLCRRGNPRLVSGCSNRRDNPAEEKPERRAQSNDENLLFERAIDRINSSCSDIRCRFDRRETFVGDKISISSRSSASI